MRILQVIPAFPPSRGYGGAPAVSYEISKRLIRRGHEVVVFTTDANDKNSRINTKVRMMDGIEVHFFKNISNLLAYNYKLFISPSMISNMGKTEEFDIIHIHDFRTFQSVLTYYFGKKFKIPYVLQPHGKPPLNNDPRAQKFKFIFDMLIGNKILQHTSKLLVLNYSEAKLYESRVEKSKIEIIPNGIDLSEYTHLPSEGRIRDRYDIPDDEFVILYLGRIHESKGLDLLVRSFSELSKKIDKIRLIVAGPDDGYLHHLYKLAASLKVKNKIIFTGYLSNEDKLSVLIDADVFATPLFYGFPLTFLEAMVCGTPIVTTSGGDYIEEIDGKIGFVTYYDAGEFGNALFEILTNDELRENFSKNAIKKVREYDWDIITAKIEKIYNSVTWR